MNDNKFSNGLSYSTFVSHEYLHLLHMPVGKKCIRIGSIIFGDLSAGGNEGIKDLGLLTQILLMKAPTINVLLRLTVQYY